MKACSGNDTVSGEISTKQITLSADKKSPTGDPVGLFSLRGEFSPLGFPPAFT
jgi:hypothetical protein